MRVEWLNEALGMNDSAGSRYLYAPQKGDVWVCACWICTWYVSAVHNHWTLVSNVAVKG